MENNNYSEKKNKFNKSYKMGGFNLIIISIVSFLYVLFITKFAEIISTQWSDNFINNVDMEYNLDNINEKNEKNKIGVYVMIIYFVSIIGIIVGYVWFNNNFSNSNNSNFNSELPNWIIRWSLSIGGVLMLIYTIINYWEFLNDYSKLLLIFLSITSIIYYLYKYY